jgi:hypothetical protein
VEVLWKDQEAGGSVHQDRILRRITIVSAPGQRITIDLDRPEFDRAIYDDFGYFPTILGEEQRAAIDQSRRDLLFSAYDVEGPLSRHSRSLVAGGGFMALVAIFIVGSDSVRRYLEEPGQDASVASKTSRPQASQPTALSPGAAAPVELPQQPSKDTVSSFKASSQDEQKPAPIKVSAPAPTEDAQTKPPKPAGKPKTTTAVQNSAAMPSTLVISSNNGKVTSTVEPAPGVTSKRTPVRNSGNITRPRVVDSPNQ